MRTGRAALTGSPVTIAQRLLGAVLTHDSAQGVVAVRLTEVEAYGGAGVDPGSHAYRGPTPRTQVMFDEPGHLYVYFSYGMHWCANVVCTAPGEAGAVLLRAGQVVEGVELARLRRPTARRDVDLARGPARLAAALGLAAAANGADLRASSSPCYLTRPVGAQGAHGSARLDGASDRRTPSQPGRNPGGDRKAGGGTVCSGPRVGVSGPGGDGSRFPWRFWLAGEPTVSVYRPGVRTST